MRSGRNSFMRQGACDPGAAAEGACERAVSGRKKMKGGVRWGGAGWER